MYISLNWIKDYVDLDGIDILNLIKNRFTLAVAEVEGVEIKGENLSGVVTGKILSVEKHPKSEKLHILKVDKGDEIIDIVCGAPNVKVGMIVPLATIGACVNGVTIMSASLAGVISNGMCCSAKEIGISDDHSGLFEFPSNTPIGVDIKSILPIDDIVFEIDNKSLTNRPDLWGHYGIAREISALTKRPLKNLDVICEDFSNLSKLDIQVNSPTCFRYSSVTMSGITSRISPITMQIRLYYAGMRTINMLTDVTNYIMLELGQPMHAFDNNNVHSIEVLDVEKETKFVTLDNEERMLPAGTMVICGDGKISAVAGVMGGLDSEIKGDTNSVLIESACFHPAKVRRTATSLGMRTEASARYEKSLDPELTMIALKRYIYLVKTIDSGAIITSDITDIYNYHYESKTIEISKDYICNYAGINFSHEVIVDTLKSLEFDVCECDGEDFLVKVPSFRATKDIQGKPDLVEEIARIYGYDNIKPISPIMDVIPVDLPRKIDAEYNIKYTLATKYNLSEIHTYLWYDCETNKMLGIEPKSHIRVVNSLQKFNDKLRDTLIPAQLKCVVDNKDEMDNFGVFEIGSAIVGLDSNGMAIEHKKLCVTLYNKIDYLNRLKELKEMIEYTITQVMQSIIKFVPANPKIDYLSPVNYYEIIAGEKSVGFIGAIHPKTLGKIDKKCGVVVAELDFSELLETPQVDTKFEKVSKYPKSELDFNFLVDRNMLYSEIEAIAKSVQSALKYTVTLLDIFDNNDSLISYTLHYTIWNDERTLTGDEIQSFHSLVIETFRNKNISLKG